MTTRIEYENKSAADAIRDEFGEYLCSEDDRRLKEVAFASDTPNHALDQARLEAEDSRGDHSEGAGQVPLTDDERGEIDFSEGRASVPHARSVKGIAAAESVSDWVAHYDPTLTVDEHRETMERAGREGGGRRREDTESGAEKAGRAARRTKDEGCDHARGHCENGDPAACEYLTDTCGYDEQEVQSLLSQYEQETNGEGPESVLSGKQKGALKRAWNGYKGAIDQLDGALLALVDNWEQAQQAARAINAIREEGGQEPIHFDRLEELQADLLEHSRTMAADCHECHAETADGREPVDETVLELDDQQTLEGDRADDQARLAGGEEGERGQGETIEHVEENSGGLRADQRESPDTGPTGESTEQQIPDEFQVAEGGQETL